MANPLTKLLSKTFVSLKVISGTPDTITVDEDEINNTVSVDKMMLTPGNSRRNDNINHINNVPDENCCTYEEGTGKNEARVGGYFPVQHIGRIVKTGERTNYFIRWYGYRQDADTVEPPDQTPQHFNASFWS